ncbi:hypothetical protein PVAND_014379 [Polypedilum vanderplanki]|uniref:Uncharacterized protein n=1 Tax=Polypedilum vanderplanki TaxID=319348 RepID=A0A9J6B9S3_POLVA|nr:hypothetical protein PVAND_014379 [Polypedilum vanderplanki]
MNIECYGQKYWGVNDKGASPYLISCTNPFLFKVIYDIFINLIPQYISIVENECDHANNVLEIKNKRPKDGHKKHFLVSVKGIDFVDDVSLLLIEWFEILKLLGVDKVEVFVVNAHVNREFQKNYVFFQIYRAANFTPNGGNAKTFMRTDRVLAVHNHFPFSCIGPENCRWFIVNLDDGQLSHIRIDCDNPECKESKANPTKDITLWNTKMKF